MRLSDIDFVQAIDFNLSTGITSFQENRLVIFNANAIGQLRQNLINKLGRRHARDFFLTFGFQSGFADFTQLQQNYEFDGEDDLLRSGPALHTARGIVLAEAQKFKFNRATGQFFNSGTWTNSYEAEQHLRFNKPSDVPVCWSLMGYATGWATAFMRKPLLAIETTCVGMGHEQCRWSIQPVDNWGHDAAPYLEAYRLFWNNLEESDT